MVYKTHVFQMDKIVVRRIDSCTRTSSFRHPPRCAAVNMKHTTIRAISVLFRGLRRSDLFVLRRIEIIVKKLYSTVYEYEILNIRNRSKKIGWTMFPSPHSANRNRLSETGFYLSYREGLLDLVFSKTVCSPGSSTTKVPGSTNVPYVCGVRKI